MTARIRRRSDPAGDTLPAAEPEPVPPAVEVPPPLAVVPPTEPVTPSPPMVSAVIEMPAAALGAKPAYRQRVARVRQQDGKQLVP